MSKLDHPPSGHADRPLALMREALALLDKSGEASAAVQLQHAIDTLDQSRAAGLDK